MTNQTDRVQSCTRCHRPMPPANSKKEFMYWEAFDDGDDVVCPDCVTPAEQEAIDEDMFETAAVAKKLQAGEISVYDLPALVGGPEDELATKRVRRIEAEALLR